MNVTSHGKMAERNHCCHTHFTSSARLQLGFCSTTAPSRPAVFPNGDRIKEVSFVGCPKYKSCLAQSLYITGLRPIELSLPLANSPDRNNMILCPAHDSAQTKISTGICTRAEVMMYFPLHKVATTASPNKPHENSANGYRETPP